MTSTVKDQLEKMGKRLHDLLKDLPDHDAERGWLRKRRASALEVIHLPL
jgi:hypothetical protein